LVYRPEVVTSKTVDLSEFNGMQKTPVYTENVRSLTVISLRVDNKVVNFFVVWVITAVLHFHPSSVAFSTSSFILLNEIVVILQCR